MNPLTNVKNIKKLNETELRLNIEGKASWHNQYKDSAWIFIGGLPYDLTEGDVICIFSQFGEVVNINLIRDKATGKSKGYCFMCYEDQRSTILAVDNLNGIKVCNRTLRVDHVHEYKLPKDIEKVDEDRLKIMTEGCAPGSSFAQMDKKDQPKEELKSDDRYKKEKKDAREEKRRRKSSSSSESDHKHKKKKKEKRDYDKRERRRDRSRERDRDHRRR